MKTWFFTTFGLVFSITATAMPHASLNQLIKQADENCNQTSSANGLRDLIEQVNVPGQLDAFGKPLPQPKDPRKTLRKAGPELGMSATDMKRAEETTGYVVCPNKKVKGTGSATLIEPGNQILTSAHIFIDDDGMPYEHLEECFFQNQANPPQRRSLNFGSKEKFKLFTTMPNVDPEHDLALVSIIETKSPISSLKPFPLDPSTASLRRGQKLVQISAAQADLVGNPEFPPTAPIAQACRYWEKSRTAKGGRMIDGVYSDCATEDAGSGSIQLVRHEDGQFAIRAIAASSGKASNLTPFGLEAQSYTFGVEITPEIYGEINQFQIATANTRTSTREAFNRGM